MKKKIWILIGVLAAIILIVAGYFYFFIGIKEGFRADSILLKVSIKNSGSFNGQIDISNLLKEDNEFKINIVGLDNLASVSEDKFSLGAEESKTLEISFSNQKSLSEGIYTGKLIISDLLGKKEIPVILEVESDDNLFDSNVVLYPSDKIYFGDKLSAEIKIFDISKIGTASVKATYMIKNFDNNVIFSETENIVVNGQVLVTKSIDLPKDVKQGDYVFVTVLEYKNSIGTSSVFLRVDNKTLFEGVLSKDITYFIILFVFFIFVLLLFVFYSIYTRDKLLGELRIQYKSELRKQEDYLKKRERENEKLLKTREEKNLNKKLFEKVKEKRKKEIVKIHRERVKKLKKLKKIKKKDELEKQIQQWRKQGYDTSAIEKKARVPTINDIKRQMSQWKRKGYNTEILREKLR